MLAAVVAIIINIFNAVIVIIAIIVGMIICTTIIVVFTTGSIKNYVVCARIGVDATSGYGGCVV